MPDNNNLKLHETYGAEAVWQLTVRWSYDMLVLCVVNFSKSFKKMFSKLQNQNGIDFEFEAFVLQNEPFSVFFLYYIAKGDSIECTHDEKVNLPKVSQVSSQDPSHRIKI